MNSCHSRTGLCRSGATHDTPVDPGPPACRMLAQRALQLLPPPSISLRFNYEISVFNDAQCRLWKMWLCSFLSNRLSWLCRKLTQLPDYILLSASKLQMFKCLRTFLSDWYLKRYFILFVFVSLKVIQSLTLGRYSSAFCLGEIHEIPQILSFNYSGPYRNSEWKSGLLEF